MDVAGVLLEHWDLKPTQVDELTGGMNSAVWLASADGWRVVVKAVDVADNAFGPGLELAGRLADAGLVTGRPVLGKARQVVEQVGERQVGVLEYVDGFELTSTVGDQRTIGELLGRVHAVSATPSADLAGWLRWLLVDMFEESLDLEDWIRPAVQGAVDEAAELGHVSWAWLHGDPAPEAFLRRPDGEVALIDWGAAMHGPVLYDVASAVMYAGTPEHVVSAYARQRPDLADEIHRGIEIFRKVRWAVQAGYFAWRCSTDVRTGIADPAENRKGLADARHGLTTSGLRPLPNDRG